MHILEGITNVLQQEEDSKLQVWDLTTPPPPNQKTKGAE